MLGSVDRRVDAGIGRTHGRLVAGLTYAADTKPGRAVLTWNLLLRARTVDADKPRRAARRVARTLLHADARQERTTLGAPPTGWTVVVDDTVAGNAGATGADLAARAVLVHRAAVDDACTLDAALSRLAIAVCVAVVGCDTAAIDTGRSFATV